MPRRSGRPPVPFHGTVARSLAMSYIRPPPDPMSESQSRYLVENGIGRPRCIPLFLVMCIAGEWSKAKLVPKDKMGFAIPSRLRGI
jgi:hypothetical protein